MARAYVRFWRVGAPTIFCLVAFVGAPAQSSGDSQQPQKNILLILDSGHGGTDHGADGGRGFEFRGQRVSEGAYTYDVAKRLERLAHEKGWKTFFTILRTQEDTIFDVDEDNLISGSEEMKFHLPWYKKIVFALRGRDGLDRRLESARYVVGQYKGATPIFISIHFDNIDPLFSGTRVFVPGGMGGHAFTQSLRHQFTENGFGFQRNGISRAMVEATNRYVLLREGTVVPRVLIELGNFNNETDRMRMLRHQGREQYAEVIMRAIEEFVK